MTDNEIIKALECCADEYIHSCDYCPFEKECNGDNLNLVKYALDLINRQKAEIEKLQTDNSSMQSTLAKMSMGVEQAKVNAIKEFAERLKSYAHEISCNVLLVVTKDDIDYLVKEMVGEG